LWTSQIQQLSLEGCITNSPSEEGVPCSKRFIK
jgi:hypothetical protein